ncbi:MAG: sigma-70 family RNA polymerase sigma factor [Planctomycetes bacterium]|nr:sigma-70 family RNA polymerase sigma factor [Planctomycetota bacterium]
MPPPAEDLDLTAFGHALDRARAGDGAALDEVLAATEARLRRVVDRRLGARLRTSLRRSDILQNAYLAMLDALPRFEGRTPDAFVAWVSQIIEHDIQRQHRWFGARKRRAPSRTSQRNALARILHDTPPTPSAEVAQDERQTLVRAALQKLEPDHARIIELAVFEGLSHREIADRLQRSEGASRMLLQRARAALALELERLTGDGED